MTVDHILIFFHHRVFTPF